CRSEHGFVYMPEQLKGPTLPTSVHLDGLFKKFTSQLITLAKEEKWSIKEQQAVRILGTPSVVSEVNWLAQCHSIPRSKYPPHSESIWLASLVGIYLELKSEKRSLRFPTILRESANTMAHFDGTTCLVSSQELNQIDAVILLNLVAVIE